MNKNKDYEKLVSRADIYVDGPVKRSEGGMPIGNGIMGSLVWTKPQSLKLQINRSDLYACNCETNSFPQRCTDYGNTCGYVDLDLPAYDEDLFTENNLKQHLSVYNALVTLKTKDVECRILAWHNRDIFMIQVEDRRENAPGSVLRLRMMRPPYVVTRNHTAESSFSLTENGIVLSQEFKEGNYMCSSALAVEVKGKSYKVVENSKEELALYLEPGQGSYMVIIGTASTFNEKSASLNMVEEEMAKARETDFATVYKENQQWWHEYWSRGYIELSSKDGKAEEVEKHYTYYLYIMGASSRRGEYPPNYGGLIWYTEGDYRAWGSQFWWNNMNNYYNGLLPTNRLEIMDPYFNMYYKMSDSLALAARQQWGSEGIYIPETSWFDGLEEMPEDIAKEMRELYLVQKPWETRSKKFMEYAHYKHPQNARWNWKTYGKYVDGRWEYEERGNGCFGRVLHLFASGGRLGHQYWLRYQYSQDKDWLAGTGYPMIKGIAEFFRNYPNLKKDKEGIYHIYLVNDQESLQGATDTMSIMIAIKQLFPDAVSASKVLGVDEELRAAWQELTDNLAPLPVSTHPQAMAPGEPGERPFWNCALFPSTVLSKGATTGPVGSDLCSLETKEVDEETFNTSLYSFRRITGVVKENDPVGDRSDITKTLAYLGLKEELKHALYNQAIFNVPERHIKVDHSRLYNMEEKLVAFENRLSLAEGYNAIEAQRLGILTGALHATLLQDNPGKPGLDPVIRIFPSLPDDWDAEFQLLSRGGFLISAARKAGLIENIEIISQHGGTCKIRNPRENREVTIMKNGVKLMSTKESLLAIVTEKGDIIHLICK